MINVTKVTLTDCTEYNDLSPNEAAVFSFLHHFLFWNIFTKIVLVSFFFEVFLQYLMIENFNFDLIFKF